MKTKIVIALLALGMLTGILMAAPPALGAPTVTLDPPKYGAYYVPGEQMQFTVTILNTDPSTLDFVVVWDDTTTYKNWSGDQFNNVNIPAPTTLSVTENFLIPNNMPDGDFYYVRVYDSTWIESNGTVGNLWDEARFSVRTWTLSVDLSKTRYLPGDTVTVIWSANMIRDGSLAPNGYGQMWAYETGPGFNQQVPGVTWPYLFSASTGTYSFPLLGSVPTNHRINIYAYFNSTASNADRFAFDTVNAPVDGLRMIVNVQNAIYQPGAIVSTRIDAKVTDNPPVAGDPGAAGVEVDITVTDQTTGLMIPQYGVQNLLTDAHGSLTYVFQLNASIADGTQFLFRADGVANNAVNSFATDTFIVRSSAALSLILTFDKSQYQSGDTVTMTASVSGSPGPFTYIYEVHDGNIGGPLLARETTTQSSYQYTIPTTFAGDLSFIAAADDGNGNRVAATRTFTVILGVLTVNLDRVEYSAGDTITATYFLTSSALTGTGITYYYEVSDASGVLVKSGIATTSTVQYTVPSAPSNSYTFRITASKQGLTLQSSATAYLVGSPGSVAAFLFITLDKSSYMPGEVITISYSLTSRSPRNPLPTQINFVIQVAGAPQKTVQTASSSGQSTGGTLTFPLPAGMNEGDVPLIVTASGISGASATEIIHVGAVNPLMADWGGVPAISVVLLLLVILLLIVMGIMWRRTAPGMGGAPRPPAEKPVPPPPPTAAPGPAPMTVACKACGASIEITTSKRPIEVMCPSCGETQMVQ